MSQLKNKKLVFVIVFIVLLIISISIGIWYTRSQNRVVTNRTGLLLDLDFGNNNGAGTPTVYDSSGRGNHATAANAQTCTPTHCDFTQAGGDYMTGAGTGVFTSDSITMYFKFIPTLGVYNNVYQALFDGVAGARYGVHKQSDGQSHKLAILLDNTTIETIAAAAYAPYWKVNEENILIVRGTSGNTDVFLNGNNILNNDATAWSPTPVSVYTVGAGYPGSSNFEGKMISVKIWDRQITDDEVENLSKDRRSHTDAEVRTKGTGQLIGYWTMDSNDINGATIYDKSGQGNNGTITGTTQRAGKINQSLDFNGSGDLISINPVPSIGTGDFSISQWIKAKDRGENSTPLFIGNEVFKQSIYFLFDDPDGVLQFGAYGVDSNLMPVISDTLLFDNKWHHIVGTKSGNTMTIYLDGVQKDQDTVTDVNVGTDTFTLGGIGAAAYMEGLMDESRIYSYALSASEIGTLYKGSRRVYMR